MAGGIVRNLIIRAGADFSSLRNEMKKAQKNIADFKSGVSGAMKGIGLALGGISIGAAISDATRSAMDVEAAMQQINRTMGQSSAEFSKWSTETAGAFNMSKANAIKYGAIFGNLISTFSSGAEDTKNKTIDVLQASAVVASGTGRTMEDVMWRIRSGLLGNTEAIEDLGINVYVNLLKTTKAFQTFAGDKSWDQLDFQTQQLIRYYGIMEQANSKFGASVNINTNSALQGFQAALGNVKLALGQAFLPILNVILPVLTTFMNWLYAAMSVFSQFTRALFGYKDPSKNVNKTSAAVKGLEGAYGGAGDAAEKAGSKADKAGKKAKKAAQGALAGFDEINNIANKADDAASGAGGGGGGGAAGGGGANVPVLPEPGNSSAMDKISDGVKKAVAKIKAAFEELKGFMSRHKDILISLAAGMAAGMATALIAVNWGKITTQIALWLTRLSGAFRVMWAAITGPIGIVVAIVAVLVAAFVYFYRTNETFRGFVDGIMIAIKNACIDLWNNVLVPFGQWLGTVLVKAWDLVVQACEWLWKNVLVPFGDWCQKFWNDALKPLAEVLGGILVDAFDAVVDIGKSLWKNVFVPLGKFLADNFGPTVDAISAVLTFLWKNVIVPVAGVIGDVLMWAFKDLTSVIKWLWDQVLKPLIPFLVGAFNDAFTGVGDIIKGLSKAFGGLMDFITGVFTGNWGKAWNGIKDVFKGVFEALYGVAKTPLNSLIGLVNRCIDGINSLDIKIPDWVPGYGGKSFGINIPHIPKLAKGGYVGANNPMLAMIGDNTREGEIVAPESKIYQQVMKAMNDNGGGGVQELVVNIGGTTVFRKIIDGINQAQKQAGKTLIDV